MSLRYLYLLLLGALLSLNVSGQTTKKEHKKNRNRSVYLSWGYNQEWYTNSNLHIQQDALGNSYDLEHIRAHDHKGWNDGVLNKAFTIPQYNYRIGYYFNAKQDLGIELNFDHTKYVVENGQTVLVTGKINHAPISENVTFSEANGFYYYLNNGANFFLFNIVKRMGLYTSHDNNLRVDLIGKAGIGPVVPHVQNSLFSQANTPHFQFGGWNMGQETVIRATIMKYAFIEFSEKTDYARYSNLKIYQGTARQSFGTIELIGSIGFILPTHKDNPMWAKKQ